mmetsp:Transcript_157507/g.482716  ORF Transcript_157507/g.482716 Transcript_157507/m.482716 type:complete len:220 (+) Transcript_157507:107-766(+)
MTKPAIPVTPRPAASARAAKRKKNWRKTAAVQSSWRRISSTAAKDSGRGPSSACRANVPAKFRCSARRAASREVPSARSGTCSGSRRTVTSPAEVKSWPGGQSSKAPWMTTGSRGAPVCSCKWKAPFLNGRESCPSALRVPSGAIATLRPHLRMTPSTISFMVREAFMRSLRLMGTMPRARHIQPKKGNLKRTFLPTCFGDRLRQATPTMKGSRLDAWL